VDKLRNLLGLMLVLMLGMCSQANAHSARAILDKKGTSPSFTALARVTCYDDGVGPAASLLVRIRDNSAPVAGLYLNLQLLKGTRAISITDTESGDADYSDYISLPAGNGVYSVILNHTRAGARDFDIEYHCITADDEHTGTDIVVDQFN